MARVLVAYASRLGATRDIARRIGEVLRSQQHDVAVQAVDEAVDVLAFDAVVIGSGVFAGHWHRPAVEFLRHNRQPLSSKPVWLFSSGPVGDMAARHDPSSAAPKDIDEYVTLVGARGHIVFLGALDRSAVDGSDLGRFEKVIAKRFIPEGDWRDWNVIETWAAGVGQQLRATAVPA